MNLYYGKISAWQLVLLCRTGISVSSRWHSASQMVQEKIYVPWSPYSMCASYCENCLHGTSSIKQDQKGGMCSLLTLPFKLHVKLCSTTSHRSVVVQPRLQRPIRKWPAHGAASNSTWSAFHYLGASFCQHMIKPCSACQKTGVIYLTFQQIRGKKKKHFKKERFNLGTLFPGELVMDLLLSLSSLSPRPQHS